MAESVGGEGTEPQESSADSEPRRRVGASPSAVGTKEREPRLTICSTGSSKKEGVD